MPVRQPDGEIKEGDARLFPMLSAGQKERLARALYGTIEIEYRDLDLVKLV